jgi:hypothetical protein
MAYSTADWIAFALFLVLCVAAVILEVMWLSRNGWTTPGKAAAYVLLTDVLGLSIGLFTVFTALGILFMMTMGGSGQGGSSPEAAYWVVAGFGLLFPPVFMFGLKRLFLLILGIRTSRSAWMYALAVTALVLVGVLIPPLLLYWLAGRVL